MFLVFDVNVGEGIDDKEDRSNIWEDWGLCDDCRLFREFMSSCTNSVNLV